MRRRLNLFNGYWYEPESTAGPSEVVSDTSGWELPGLAETIDRWRLEAASVTRFLNGAIGPDLNAMSDAQLGEHIERYLANWSRSNDRQAKQKLYVLMGGSYEQHRRTFFTKLLAVLGSEVGIDGSGVPVDHDLASLLVGRNRSSDGDKTLMNLAQTVLGSSALRVLFAETDTRAIWAELLLHETVHNKFAADLRAYLHTYGTKAAETDVVLPVPYEDPPSLIGVIQTLVNHPPALMGQSGQSAFRREIRRRVAAAHPGSHEASQDFERALRMARRTWSIKESRDYYALRAWGIARILFNEVGSRLEQRGQLADRNDIVHVTAEQAVRSLLDSSADLAVTATANGQTSEEWRAIRPPEVVSGAYREYRFSQGNAGVFRGIAASAGMYVGTARVIQRLADLRELRTGEVLVTRMTTPAWTTAFMLAGAVVTDYGGFGSHAALIAREYGRPCVTGLQNASYQIRTGMRLVVDGSAGEVTLSEDLLEEGSLERALLNGRD